MTSEDRRCCTACGARLSADARLCHRCGAAGGSARSASEPRLVVSFLPWAVAGLAVVALIALVAGQSVGRPNTSLASEAAAAQSPVRGPDLNDIRSAVLAARTSSK